ncbi:MAG: hypothetical protein ACYC5N_02440 [Endomicrobiales bacterium]
MKIMKSMRGQAVIESMLIVVLLTIVLFAALQIVITVVNDMVANEAAFSAARAATVTPGDDTRLKEKSLRASMALLSPHFSSRNVLFANTNTETNVNSSFPYYSKGGSIRLETAIDYTSRILFPSLVNPDSRKALTGKTGLMQNTAHMRMIKSPDEDYYDKAYFGARSFNN